MVDDYSWCGTNKFRMAEVIEEITDINEIYKGYDFIFSDERERKQRYFRLKGVKKKWIFRTLFIEGVIVGVLIMFIGLWFYCRCLQWGWIK